MTEVSDISSIFQQCSELYQQARAKELLQCADQALAMRPNEVAFITFRLSALYLLGKYAEAAALWQSAPACRNNPAPYWMQAGYCLMMAGDLKQAIALLRDAQQKAIAGGAQDTAREIDSYLGEAMLKAGDPQGFTHWLRRNDAGMTATGNYCPADIPAWSGEMDLKGKRVLVTHQLGFGDNFLLNACVQDWLDAGATVMISCDAQIHALMQASLPACEVISAPRPLQIHQPLPDALRAPVQAFAPHLHATLLHLPLLKAARATAGYRFSPYIRASHAKQQIAAEWAAELRAQHPGKKLVGLFWDCHQRHAPDADHTLRWSATRRSLPLEAINRLVTDPAIASQVHFVSLQHRMVQEEAGSPVGNVSNYLCGIQDFDDTAACIGQLDAALAVDSSVANLALMAGKSTCVPVNTSREWRWGCCTTASPWFDNATILQQTHEGDWEPVVRDIAAWLMQRSGARDHLLNLG